MTFDPPRALIYGAGVTGGVLVALAAHILLSGAGIRLSDAWREGATAGPDQIRWAVAWWAIAGAGFVTSWLTAGMLRSIPQRRGLSLGQWLLAAGFVVLLAAAGRGGAAPGSVEVAHSMLASLAAMLLAAVAAALACHFAARP